MRRSRKKRETVEVSLFPFLAVLICTLGVLIVLLVLAVKAADVEAREVRESQQDESKALVSDLDLQLSTHLVRVEGLQQVRPEAVRRLANVRTHRGHLEDEIRRLDEKAKELAQRLKQLDHTSAAPEASATDEEIKALNKQIEQAREKLVDVRNQSNVQQPVSYSIVPEASPGGTHRRPIYIECTDDEIILQPHKVVLRSGDFSEPFAPGNPLDAALLAIREYWTKYDLAGDEGHPYPLMVIRPSGAQSYAVSRRAMKSWDSEFGYEIIEADKKLDFGEHDPQLKEIILTAVENAKRQQIYVAAMRRRLSRARGTLNGSENSRPGLVASGPNGGFVSEGGYRNNVHQERRTSLAANRSSVTTKEGAAFGSVLDRYRNVSTNSTAKIGNDSDFPTAKNNPSVNPKSADKAEQKSSAPDTTSASPKTVSSLAAERGENWALPTRTPGATGYLRPIRIYCGPDQLQIQRTQFDRVTIPFTGPTENAVAPMVDNIWQLIDQWGVAGANGYWKPQLRFSILSGGQTRFEEIKMLLDQSGLGIERNPK